MIYNRFLNNLLLLLTTTTMSYGFCCEQNDDHQGIALVSTISNLTNNPINLDPARYYCDEYTVNNELYNLLPKKNHMDNIKPDSLNSQ